MFCFAEDMVELVPVDVLQQVFAWSAIFSGEYVLLQQSHFTLMFCLAEDMVELVPVDVLQQVFAWSAIFSGEYVLLQQSHFTLMADFCV
jgi:hypothetical protein